MEHVPIASGGRRLFTAATPQEAVQFLLEKACMDGLVPFDLGYEQLLQDLIKHRSYRDAGYAYTILETEGPAAYNM